ncbi:MAG: LytR C-terminal domain-containing protein [Marmoricola sp.]
MSGRKVTTAVTLLVLLAVLGGMAIYGFNALTAPFPGSSATEKKCSRAEKQMQGFLTRTEVQVSIFNAGKRKGLASTTLDRVEAAGFRAGNAGNAPKSAEVRRAVVWTTKPNDQAAELVARAFGRRTRIAVTHTDLGPGIDVLVGNKFKGLAAKAPRRIRLAAPVETCIPVD